MDHESGNTAESLLRQELAMVRSEFNALRRETEGLRRLVEISRDLSSILDRDALCHAILDAAIRLTGAQRGFLLALDGSGVSVLMGRGSGQESLDREMSRVSETLVRQCLQENRVVPYDKLSQLPEFKEIQSIRALSLYAAVCVPMREQGVPTGVFYVDSSSPGMRPSESELLLLEAFASQAAVALLNARLLRESEERRMVLSRENDSLRAEVRTGARMGNILGQSKAISVVFDKIRLLKDSFVPVLILGESGTGKELVARALHYEGFRRDGPFVPVNCAGLPPDLLDSLMFGHRRGAFTGATSDSPGLVEQADGGSLFLDEVGDMPLPLQVKLLRFMESGEFRRVGEVGLRKADTRVISATNRNLGDMVRDKSFREDLYFRIAGVTLEIPPLCDRREDIPMLVDHFLAKALERAPRSIRGLSEEARGFLVDYHWPGNVRELRHAIEGACALVPEGGWIEEEHLLMILPRRARGSAPGYETSAPDRPGDAPEAGGKERTERGRWADEGAGSDPVAGARDARWEAERRRTMEALEKHAWNITRAARELGLARQYLHRRIRDMGLKRPR